MIWAYFHRQEDSDFFMKVIHSFPSNSCLVTLKEGANIFYCGDGLHDKNVPGDIDLSGTGLLQGDSLQSPDLIFRISPYCKL